MLVKGVVAQHVPGFPTRGQVAGVMVQPAVLLIINLILIFFASRVPLFVVALSFIIQLIWAISILALATGGV
jgi:hypothetical protein